MLRDEYSAGAVVYRVRGGRRYFLFLVRAGSKTWLDSPKGHVEAGESSEEAAARETREESGLVVELDPFFRHDALYFFRSGKDRIRKHVRFFLSEVAGSPKVKVSPEHAGYRWLAYGDAVKAVSFDDQRKLLEHAEDYAARKDAMASLNSEYGGLPGRTKGWRLSRRLVPGEGPLDAKVMVIGQAPGRFEDEAGRPFVGASGKLLDRMLRVAGMRRDAVYITSVVQFFPPGNRMPAKDEVAQCRDFLFRQIGIVKPEVIVLLGNLAAEQVAGSGKVMSTHGKATASGGVTYFTTLHPAAAVRLKSNVPIITEDFERLGEILSGKG